MYVAAAAAAAEVINQLYKANKAANMFLLIQHFLLSRIYTRNVLMTNCFILKQTDGIRDLGNMF